MSIFIKDDNRADTPAFKVGVSQTLTITTSSQQTAAFDSNTSIVRVVANSGHFHVAFGASPTASITTSVMINPNCVHYFKVNSGDKMAYIKDVAVTTAYGSVTEVA